jgi:hypothetical protein
MVMVPIWMIMFATQNKIEAQDQVVSYCKWLEIPQYINQKIVLRYR